MNCEICKERDMLKARKRFEQMHGLPEGHGAIDWLSKQGWRQSDLTHRWLSPKYWDRMDQWIEREYLAWKAIDDIDVSPSLEAH